MSKVLDERRKPQNGHVPVDEVTRPRPLDDAPIAQNGNGHKPVPTIGGRAVDPAEISAEVEQMGAQEAIAWAVETFGPKLTFAVSFQKTTSVTVDMAHRINPSARFVYVDTELLFPETYKTRDRLSEHFGIEFERFVQDNPPGLAERWRAGEWGRDRRVLRATQGRYHAPRPRRGRLLGLRCPPNGFRDSRRRPAIRLGRPLRSLEAESPRRLG